MRTTELSPPSGARLPSVCAASTALEGAVTSNDGQAAFVEKIPGLFSVQSDCFSGRQSGNISRVLKIGHDLLAAVRAVLFRYPW
jgi:hypothetical protein